MARLLAAETEDSLLYLKVELKELYNQIKDYYSGGKYNVTIEFVSAPEKILTCTNETCTGVIGMLQRGEADFSLSFQTVNAEFNKYVDYIGSGVFSSLMVATKRNIRQSTSDVIKALVDHDKKVWSLLIVTFVVIWFFGTEFRWVLKKYLNARDNNPARLMLTFLLQGTSGVFRYSSTRVLGGAILISFMVTNFIILSFLNTDLVVEEGRLIRSLEELLNRNDITPAVLATAWMGHVLEDSENKLYKRLKAKAEKANSIFTSKQMIGNEEIFEKFVKGKYALIGPKAHLSMMIETAFCKASQSSLDDGDVFYSAEDVIEGLLMITARKTLEPHLKKYVHKLSFIAAHSGIGGKWVDVITKPARCMSNNPPEISVNDLAPLSISNLRTMLYIWCSGNTVAFLVFLYELMTRRGCKNLK